MAEKRGQYQYNDDGTVSQLVQSNTIIDESKAIVPVDIQARLSQTIQTHSGVTVGPTNGTALSAWVDCDGFDSIGLTFMNSASTSSEGNVYWSHDGTTNHGKAPKIIASGTDNLKDATIPVRARYFKLELVNLDATPRTMTAYAYLKA